MQGKFIWIVHFNSEAIQRSHMTTLKGIRKYFKLEAFIKNISVCKGCIKSDLKRNEHMLKPNS